jgi:hypothetical protein
MRRDLSERAVDLDRPVLVWRDPSGREVQFPVRLERPMTIGRDATNSVSIDSAFVSKTHAVLQYTGGQLVIEDLKSANGTRLNGAPIATSIVKPGDVIEVGDQQLQLVDLSAKLQAPPPAAGARSKAARLIIAALATAVVTMLLMLTLVMLAPVDEQPAEVAAGPEAAPVPPPRTPGSPVPPDPAIVGPVLERARLAGVPPADALYDDAVMHQNAGRLREAVHLLSAALERAADHEGARYRLGQAQAALDQQIQELLAEAESASAQLRHDQAILAWERAIALLDPADPRYAKAEAGLSNERARKPQ